MVATTTKKGLRKAELTDNLRDFETGSIAGGGQHANMDALDDAIFDTLADAKGDLIAATAANAVARLAVGADHLFLQADAAEATGLKWGGTWTAFTPTLDQGGAVAATVTYARYARIGKTAVVQIHLAATAAGSAGSAIAIASIPAAIAPLQSGAQRVAGTGVVLDTGTNVYVGAALFASATTVTIWADAGGNPIGIAPNFALAAGDAIAVTLVYEIA